MRIALVGCREHSTRLYRKNMRLLNGKELIRYTLDQLVECGKFFDLRLLATDWMEILELVNEEYPIITPIQLPRHLAKKDVPAKDYIIYALDPYHKIGNEYCLLQPTSPLRQTELIYDTYKEFEKQYNSLFTINKYTLETDGQIYWFRDFMNIYRKPSKPYFCDPSVDVDYEYNLRIAEYLLKERENNE